MTEYAIANTASSGVSSSGARAPAVVIRDCSISPRHDGSFVLTFSFEREGVVIEGTTKVNYDASLDEVTLACLSDEQVTVTYREILDHLSARYDFERESVSCCPGGQPEMPPSIAFTVRHSTAMGGGTLNIFRYINWLTDLGCRVTVYSDDYPPAWMSVNARFKCITDDQARYGAIAEPVVVVYSVLEIPLILRYADTCGKRIYHLCQGVEEFHYAPPATDDLMTPVPLFDLLNTLPVGRIVVSPHLQYYFRQKYQQDAILIANGVDLDVFRPAVHCTDSENFRILVCGNPNHALKGVRTVKDAVMALAARHAEWKLHLLNSCGEQVLPEQIGHEHVGVYTYELRCGNTSGAMRELYSQSDLFVSSSWYEGFGLPVLEAMACGTPVVMTESHGLDGIAEDGVNCLKVPVGDVAALAAAMERLLKDAALRIRLIENGRTTAEHFSLFNQKQMFVAGFEQVTGFPFASRSCNLAGGTSPFFSILVPTYNQAEFLRVALDSLLAQTYAKWEAVVVNDGSTDHTSRVLAEYAERDTRIRVFCQKNAGVGSALNRALAETQGDWICWLSSDDLFLPDKLACHVEVIRNDSGVRFMHTNYLVLYEEDGSVTSAPIDVATFIPPVEEQLVRFLEINYVNGISIAVHRSVFDAVGTFNASYQYGQDFDLWMRISARFRSRFIDKPTCVTRIHAGQGTSQFVEAGIYDSARAALACLNSQTLEELFPLLDLDQPEQMNYAFIALSRVLVNPKAFVNRCGYAAAVWDRLKTAMTPRRAEQLSGFLKMVMNRPNALGLSSEILQVMLKLLQSIPMPVAYVAHDWRTDLECHADKLAAAGEQQEVAAIRRYITMVTAANQVTAKRSLSSAVPLFSVLVPTYNQADFLCQSLDSLLAQTVADWEAVVVNDGSTDHTQQVLAEYAARDARIRVFHKENGGVGSALNRALSEARGEWICWLSSDDLFLPDKLACHLAVLKKEPGIRFMHTNHGLLYEDTGIVMHDVVQSELVIPPQEFQVLWFFRFNYVNGITIAVRRDVFNEIGGFDETLHYGQDYDLWLRISARYPSRFISQSTSITRIHPDQGTNRFMKAGILDSCCAAIQFLNSHSFRELFPLLNLLNPAEARAAVQQSLCVLADRQAYLHSAGFGRLLADRLMAWLADCADPMLQQELKTQVKQVCGLIALQEGDREVLELFEYLGCRVGVPPVYKSQECSELLESYRARLCARGQGQQAAVLDTYLNYRTDIQMDGRATASGMNKGLKILFVLHDYLPQNVGGVESYCHRMAKALQELGHHLAVFYPFRYAGARLGIEPYAWDGIPAFRLIGDGVPPFTSTLENPEIEQLFKELLIQEQFDLVHIQHLQFLPNSLVSCASEVGVPVVVTLHDFWLLCLRTHLFRGVGNVCQGPVSKHDCLLCMGEPGGQYEQFMEERAQSVRRLLTEATMVSAPSRFVADMFARYGIQREIEVRPLGVEPCPQRRRQLGQELVFGYIGSINEIKNVFGLVHAFSKTKGNHARLRIHGCGTNQIISLLREFISDPRIEFCGGYQPHELCSILAGFDVTVVPSYIESYCLTVRESLAAGVPVLAAQVGGIPEAVCHKENGILFDPNDLDMLRQYMQQMIDTPEMVSQLAGKIEPVLTITQDAAKWSSCYQEIVGVTRECC